MVTQQGISPGKILVLMFNREARFQCRERLGAILPEGRRPDVHTFHSFAASIEWWTVNKLGFQQRTLWESGSVAHHVRVAALELARDEVLTYDAVDSLDIEQAVQAIELWKSKLIPPEKAGHRWDDWRTPFVYERFEQMRRTARAKTFSDFVPRALLCLENPKVARAYLRFSHVIVDEAQDVNWAQWKLLLKLVKGNNASLMLIGDDDQCLVDGTQVTCYTGTMSVEDVSVGDHVITGAGRGQIGGATVTDRTRRYVAQEPVVKIRTASGKELVATRDHILFAGLAPRNDIHVTYLMYRSDRGYRIGVSTMKGLKLRLNQERADAAWVLRATPDRSEAIMWENWFSVTYGVPTVIFHRAGRTSKITDGQIRWLFDHVDTEAAAEALLESEGISDSHPHHRALAGRNTSRLNFTITLCADARHGSLHRFSLSGTNEWDRLAVEDLGTRSAKHRADGVRGWRMESQRADLGQIYEIYEQVKARLPHVFLRERAALADTSLPFMPAGNLFPGMLCFVLGESDVEVDEIVSVEHTRYTGYVNDLNVDRTHNYVAGGILVHNCIYAWRGASSRYLQSGIQTDLGPVAEYELTRSFRLGAVVAQMAQNVIDHNRERAGSHVVAHDAAQHSEVELIKGGIETLGVRILDLVREKQVHPRAIMVLGRTHAQLVPLSGWLAKKKIPHLSVGREQFHQRAECQRLLDYVRLAMQLEDDITDDTRKLLLNIVNVPLRYINKNQLRGKLRCMDGTLNDALFALQEDQGYNHNQRLRLEMLGRVLETLAERLDEGAASGLHWLTNVTQYEKHWMNWYGGGVEALARVEGYKTLIDYARTEQLSLREFISHTDNLDTTLGESEEQQLLLMTSFKAKGLEAPIVVIPNAQEGFMPVLRENDIGDPTFDRTKVEADPWELDSRLADERRLFYVSMTRAKQRLIVHMRDGAEYTDRPPSRFVAEMETDRTAPLFSALQRVKAGVDDERTLLREVAVTHRQPILEGLYRYLDGDLLRQAKAVTPTRVEGFAYPDDTQPSDDGDGPFTLSQAWWEVQI
jgi:DNA helicase-2/ATP-dependent DNA helicase PcrA